LVRPATTGRLHLSWFVMRGLDPRIQRFVAIGDKALDRQVKPGRARR